MNIEVGEYIKLKDNQFARIEKIGEKDPCYHDMQMYRVDVVYKAPGCFSAFEIYDEDIVEHHKNILELIKDGDIVEIQNKLDGVKTIFNVNSYTINVFKRQIENGDIKLISVMTKEKFKKESYEVVE